MIDGASNQILDYIPETYYQLDIKVDTANDRIYVLDPGLTVIDGATNTVTHPPGGCYGATSLVLDPPDIGAYCF